MITENIRICDIETKVVGERPDPEKDILVFVGFMELDGTKRMFHANDRDAIQYGLSSTNFIIGHNFKDYDAVVLKRHGFKIWPTIIIDTLDILKKRAKQMMYLDLSVGQLSLRYLAGYFGLTSTKGDIDYDIFKQDTWSDTELTEIKHYLDGDLDTSFALFEYLYNFFIGFKGFVSDDDKDRMAWMTASPGGVAYKAVCHMAGIKEEYDDEGNEESGIQYKGAYVALPEVDFVDGDIYCADFSSLYPHMFMGGNLYSPSHTGWHGSGVFSSVEDNPDDGIIGTYSRDRGKIEQTIQDLYNLRVDIRHGMKDMDVESQEWKTADARQLATKIIINTIYGISGSRLFKNVFSITTASDCTSMARLAIKHAREELTNKGFDCLYTDTDSVYFKDPFKNFSYVKHVCSDITMTQRESFNIDIETHDFEIEAKIKRMYFFRNDDGDFVKKLYSYVKDNDKIVLKGIPLVKGTCSQLSKSIYDEHIKPKQLDGVPCIHSLSEIEKWVRESISVDNVVKRFRVMSVEAYKSTSCIQAQIADRYGAGEHYLVPNNIVGAGKGVKYATIDDIREYGDVLDYVDVRKYIGELRHFIDHSGRGMIKMIGQNHVCKSFSISDDEEKTKLAQHVSCRTCKKNYVRVKFKKSGKWEYYEN